MGFFSRNKEAVDPGRGNDVPFETVRRSPRVGRKSAAGDSRFDSGAPLDPANATRTRARRRLIGAVALALAAIVFVPMLFDRTPVVQPDDISLQIPDRDTPFEGRRGVPDPARGPLVPSADLPAATPVVPPPSTAAVVGEPASPSETAAARSDKPAAAEPKVEPAPSKVEPVPSKVEPGPPKVDKPAVAKAPEIVEEKPVDKPKSVTTTTAPAGTGDDPRAVAALEGRSATAVTVTTAPAPEATNGRGYAVQIAAYSSADKARQMRDQLVAGGLKSYVESVSTHDGLRTRVRLGPFPSRDAADRARAKLKTMKLDGSVVPL